MVKVIHNKQEAYRLKNGTFRVGEINRTYMDLVTGLGIPTFNEPSGDNKVQVEWVCEFNGKIFTIYDWKTYDREFTEHSLTKFNVGSKDVSGLEVQEFIEFVKGQIEYAYDNFDLV